MVAVAVAVAVEVAVVVVVSTLVVSTENIVVTSAGYEPSCMVHWVFGIHLVTTSGPCCTVQQTPGGSALVQSLRPSMDVRQSVLVLMKGVVPDIAIAVVIAGEVVEICTGNVVEVSNDAEFKASVVVVAVVVSVAVVDMASIVVTSAGYEPSCMVHWVFGIHLVTTSGPCCTVQQTPGGSALVQSLRPSMDVRQSVFVLTNGVVPDTTCTVVIPEDVVVSTVKVVVVAVVVVAVFFVEGIVVKFDECSGDEA